MAQTTYCDLQEKSLQSFFSNSNGEIDTRPRLNVQLHSICWKPNAIFRNKDDITTIYIKIIESEDFNINESQEQYNTNTTNNNESQLNTTITQTPNDEQLSIINKFQSILLGEQQIEYNKPQIFLLTGAPGAGKSYTVKSIMQMAKNMKKIVIGTSYNGIAAVNINGDTLCGLLNYKAFKKSDNNKKRKQEDTKVSELQPFTYEQNQKFKQNLCLQDLSLLIIDEISTVSPEMLGILDIRMRHARDINNIPFGGVPVLFVGDFSQLPPVMAKGLTYKLLQMIRKK